MIRRPPRSTRTDTLSLHDALPISKYIPEFKNPKVIKSFNKQDSTFTTEPAVREITIRHLLTHSSGIDYAVIGSPEFKAIYAKAGIPSGIGNDTDVIGNKMKLLGTMPLKHQPGEQWTYGLNRTEERRGGKGWVSTCRSGWLPGQ